MRLRLSLFFWRETGRGRDARRSDRASAPGAGPKIRSTSSTSDLMPTGSILSPGAGCIGGWHGEGRYLGRQVSGVPVCAK
jgi:hypothetical protein